MRPLALSLAASLLVAAPSATNAEGSKQADENTLYALGVAIARDLKELHLSPQELESRVRAHVHG